MPELHIKQKPMGGKIIETNRLSSTKNLFTIFFFFYIVETLALNGLHRTYKDKDTLDL